MKRYLLYFFMMLFPLMSFADDDSSCTSFHCFVAKNTNFKYIEVMESMHDGCEENGKYKQDYTIDTRCYVTDEQKQTIPYNTVVKVWTKGCSGVIVKNTNDENLYVYTAGHCIDRNSDGIYGFLVPNGNAFSIKQPEFSEFFKFGDDMAVFKIPQDIQNELPYTTVSTNTHSTKFNIVGYGAVPIFSDSQIRLRRKLWKEYIKNNRSGTTDIKDKIKYAIIDFWHNINDKFKDMPYEEDKRLKVSYNCKLYGQNRTLVGEKLGWNKNVCLASHGDSGGAIFDSDGNLVFIINKGIWQASIFTTNLGPLMQPGQTKASDAQRQLQFQQGIIQQMTKRK